MNKKSLFGLFAMGALLFTASCQEEDVVKQAQENSLATVSINVTTPEMGVATRAMTFGNGKTAKTLHYAVYNVKDQGLTYLPDLTVDNHPIDISTTVDLQLVTGNDYKVIFWAGNDAAISSSDQERLYTLNWDAKDENGACKPTMTVNYDYALSNQEAYDAFFNWMDINVDKSKTVSITLNRPFAQLNIGASDIDKAKSAGYTLQKTEVRMTAYTTLDFWSRDVDRESETTDVIIFDPTNYPNYGKTKPATEEELAASDWEEYQVKGYEYMAMNYLLRPLDENRELEDVEFYFYAEDGEMKERKYASVPFRRNWRTNVYGQLITSDVDVNVTINPIFEGSYNIGVWDGHTLAKPYSFLNDNNTPDNDKDDFYEVHVYNGAELAYIADAINGGHQSNAENNGTRAADPNDNVDYYTATIVLKENVDLGGENWKPIYGVKSINDKGKEVLKRFTGTFDGNGHTISNLYVSTEGNASAGLFATTGGIIKNLTVIDAKIYGHYKAGVIAGDGLCGKFENCKVDASNPAKPNVVLSTPHQTETGYNDANHVGGIVGYLSAEPTGYVKGCTVKNTVITGFRDVAGIAGTANTTKYVPEVTGNMIENVTITANQTVEYVDNGKDGNAGAIAGRIHANTKMENNTVGENVTVIRKVDSTKEMEYAVADAQNGDIIYVGNGEVALPHFTGKSLKFIGIHENAAIAEPVSSHIDEFWKGSSLSFENLKIKGTSYTGAANGYVKSAKEEYTNCKFVDGYYMFSGDVTTVTGCTFTGKFNSYFWTGSADDITFTDCQFNGVERIVKVCTVGHTGVERNVTFNGCSFSATEQNKAAIEIDGTKGSSYIVNINNCQETGFAAGEFTGMSMFNIVEEADVNTVDVYVDGNKFVAEGLLEDEEGNQIASTDKGLKTALSSKKENIYLTTGEFNVDLYSIADRQTLNIVGTEGTKVKFSNLQVRASQFDNFTIEGCEIMRMPNKSWGHLVFGSSNKANGVYTIKNCVFNGVGSQGIYINEQVSGATYNIIDCTFNGDFGGEGAVTIQNNDGVNHTVNVTGCTFNNIPDTSHEIYILYGYNGWTLNAEGVDAYWKTGE